MIRQIKNTLLYGGLEKDVYERYRKVLLMNDAKYLFRYILTMGVGFLILSGISFISSGFAHLNGMLYLLSAMAFFLLAALQLAVNRFRGRDSRLHTGIVLLFMACLYAESIVVSLWHPEMPAVTFIGVLLVLPLLFSLRPVLSIPVQGVFVVVFCMVMSRCKQPEIIAIDVWNGITFGIISFASIIIAVPIRIKSLIQGEVIREMSETDMLTGLKNRNAFELAIRELAQLQTRPVCVYADVNGLHELNNTKGHEAGDELLRVSAGLMKQHFGTDRSYRVGGDEFLAFTYAHTAEEARQCVARMEEALTARDYHIAIGVVAPERDDEPITDLVRRAEAMMFEEKRRYYTSVGHDRRVRQ